MPTEHCPLHLNSHHCSRASQTHPQLQGSFTFVLCSFRPSAMLPRMCSWSLIRGLTRPRTTAARKPTCSFQQREKAKSHIVTPVGPIFRTPLASARRSESSNATEKFRLFLHREGSHPGIMQSKHRRSAVLLTLPLGNHALSILIGNLPAMLAAS